MKNAFHYIVAVGFCLGAIVGIPDAHAAPNESIAHALESRPELSDFTNALKTTGVWNELGSGYYTILAPTNAAFAKLPQAEYPCLYSNQCSAQIASILRNHVLSGMVYVGATSKMQGGIYAINHRFIELGQDGRRHYMVDGKPVLEEMQLGGGVLYEIGGVIANDRELADLRLLPYPPVMAGTPVVSDRVKEKTYYSPTGRPDGFSESTIITKTTTYTPVIPSTPGY